uniref:Uncharacterized protein n=1 Tax=Anguilla anguilla TaxID=7936 RepID=A0A0E9V8N0_ANGAN
MLTITLKTLQQQTFKIQIDEELTVSHRKLSPSKYAGGRGRGLGKAGALA